MMLLQLSVVLLFIFMGARLGSIGMGLAGGTGVLVLTLVLQMQPASIPTDVILIIIAVICAVAAMQVAGGLEYLVQQAEKVLSKHPKHITFLAPAVTYIMTLLAGTGHTAYSTLPVIAEVAKENGVRPSRPLSISVIASQIAITASPVSAAVVIFSDMLELRGVSYLELLATVIPATFVACMVTALLCNFLGVDLKEDDIYQQRLAKGIIAKRQQLNYNLPPCARLSVIIFTLTIVAIVIYATLISNKVGVIQNPVLPRNEAIIAFMLTAATLIVLFADVDASALLNASTFTSGMSACVCVMGVAWLGNTFVAGHIDGIQLQAGEILQRYPWLLAVALFFASMLLYSQAATTRTLMPLALTLVDPVTAIASFAAVSALFVLPTYPTLLAAVEMDDTGSTRIGKLIFNHSFLIPGTTAIFLSVLFSFLLAPLTL